MSQFDYARSRKLLHAAPAIIEASSEAIATIDYEGNINGFNAQFELLIDFNLEGGSSVNITELFEAIEIERFRGPPINEFEPFKISKRDGSSSWVLLKMIEVGRSSKEFRTLLVHDPDNIRRIIDRLDYVENYDIPTGLINRRKGIYEFEQLQLGNFSGGAILIKLESSYHDKGTLALLDENLKHISENFNSLETQAFICRLSESELLAIFTKEGEIRIEELSSLANQIEQDDRVSPGMEIMVSYSPWQGKEQSVNDILDQLKVSLLKIKNPELFSSVNTREHDAPRSTFISKLELALKNNEMEYYIQPQIDSNTREVTGGELLVRWIPAPDVVITPNQFIHFLEQGELAEQFFDWSLTEAIRVLSKTYSALGHWIPMAINLAAPQFNNPKIMKRLAREIRKHNIPTHILEIEITERLLAEDPQIVYENLSRLKKQGFKIAIDDFGTGYSSLAYLRKYPLDRLKIDRVFISNLRENEEDRLIVTSVVSLAHILGLEVIAEGIEEPYQTSFLKDIGCEFLQGFLIGKPMPVDAFINFCQQSDIKIQDFESHQHFKSTRSIAHTLKPVKWKKSFSTDVVSVDNEHRELIDALNFFTQQYINSPDSINIIATLDTIATETMKHFKHEEEVMFNIGYPRYEIHREKHKWLIADIGKRKMEIKAEDANTSFEEVLQYLKYWLLRHLISEDTHLSRYINKPKVERRL